MLHLTALIYAEAQRAWELTSSVRPHLGLDSLAPTRLEHRRKKHGKQMNTNESGQHHGHLVDWFYS